MLTLISAGCLFVDFTIGAIIPALDGEGWAALRFVGGGLYAVSFLFWALLNSEPLKP